MNALSNVLEQAELAAAAHVPAAANTNTSLAVVGGTTAGALAPLGQPSLTDFLNSGGMVVDQYINVKPSGVTIGDSKAKLETIPVIVDMADLTPLWVARVEVGGNTTFYKSYNGSTTARGENFHHLVDLKGRAPGAKSSGIYQSVEISCELAEDLKDSKGALVADAGTTVGFTPSLTGFKEFQQFAKKLAKIDPTLIQARLRINLNAKDRSNKNGNEWVVLDYEYLGLAEG